VEEFLPRVFTGWVLSPALAATADSGATKTVQTIETDGATFGSSSARTTTTVVRRCCLNGTRLTAGRTALQDLNDAIDNIAYHPNVAPFISKQLIQQAGSKAIQARPMWRVSLQLDEQPFLQHSAVRGVKAILLDPEARGVKPGSADRTQLRQAS